eukprot:8999844-Ditylum_brightwellii.AAC.1
MPTYDLEEVMENLAYAATASNNQVEIRERKATLYHQAQHWMSTDRMWCTPSQTCTAPKERHQCAATCENPMGGSKLHKNWDPNANTQQFKPAGEVEDENKHMRDYRYNSALVSR